MSRVLVAGIGNVFFGDDGFGVEVVRRLEARGVPAGVRAEDFGIRSLDLAFALQGSYELAILVDAVHRGGAPGTLYVIDPDGRDGDDDARGDARAEGLAPHGMDPAQVIAFARSMGPCVPRLRVVGCEPLTFGDGEEVTVGFSDAVAGAIERAADLVTEIVEDALRA